MSNMRKFIETKKTAKAIYIVSGLKEMWFYLDGKVEQGDITEKESDEIIDSVTKEYASMTTGRRKEIENMLSI